MNSGFNYYLIPGSHLGMEFEGNKYLIKFIDVNKFEDEVKAAKKICNIMNEFELDDGGIYSISIRRLFSLYNDEDLLIIKFHLIDYYYKGGISELIKYKGIHNTLETVKNTGLHLFFNDKEIIEEINSRYEINENIREHVDYDGIISDSEIYKPFSLTGKNRPVALETFLVSKEDVNEFLNKL